MLLYIHVPFCRKRCSYCTFYSLPVGNNPENMQQVDTFGKDLLREIALWSSRLGNVPVETVFFGGGTPSLLSPKLVEGILSSIAKGFALQNKAEITLEANPESATANFWLEDVKKAGVNRLSLGVQSFNDTTLQILGRLHTAKGARLAYELARRAGIHSINLDLMWGLPGLKRPQSPNAWIKELQAAVELDPDHISAYGLTLEDDTTLAKALNREELVPVSEKNASQMFIQGAEFLESKGLLQYEISNFARLGFTCQHNLGYWSGENYIGLGPGATSTMGGQRWTNPENLNLWRSAVKQKTIGTTQSGPLEKLDQHTKNKELLMLSLRTTKGLNLPDWQNRTGQNFCKTCKPLVDLLVKNRLATVRQGYFRLTKSGLLVSSTIIGHLFEHLDNLHKRAASI